MQKEYTIVVGRLSSDAFAFFLGKVLKSVDVATSYCMGINSHESYLGIWRSRLGEPELSSKIKPNKNLIEKIMLE